MDQNDIDKIILDLKSDMKLVYKINIICKLIDCNQPDIIKIVKSEINDKYLYNCSIKILQYAFVYVSYEDILSHLESNNISDNDIESAVDAYVLYTINSRKEKHNKLDIFHYDLDTLNIVFADIGNIYLNNKPISFDEMPIVQYTEYTNSIDGSIVSSGFIIGEKKGYMVSFYLTSDGKYTVGIEYSGQKLKLYRNISIDLTKYNRQNKIEELLKVI